MKTKFRKLVFSINVFIVDNIRPKNIILNKKLDGNTNFPILASAWLTLA